MITIYASEEDKRIREKYLGVEYQHLGRENALDCWGLIVSIYNDFGIQIFDLENYSEDDIIAHDLFSKHYSDSWTKVEAPRFLDVILINNKNGIPFHAGVFLKDNQFIHATKIGVLITRFSKNIPLNGIYRYDYDKILLIR